MANSKIEEAKRILKNADRMIHVTFPVIGENRLFVKILEEIGKSMDMMIKAVFENENVKTYSEKNLNFDVFSRFSSKYGIDPKELDELKRLLEMVERHKKSEMEFSRKDKLVMMSEGLSLETISLERLKFHMSLSKDMLKRAENTLSKSVI